MATKDPLIGQKVRITADATTLKGRPHQYAGQEATVLDKTPGGRQYQLSVGNAVITLPMADFEAAAALPSTHSGSDAALHELVPSRTNRVVREDDDLHALAATIKMVGIISPITVRRLPPHRLQDTFEREETRSATYEIIAGERRWRAAKIAGIKRVPISVHTADDTSALVIQLIENLHRADLNPLDEARGIQRLIDEHNYTREAAAEAVHKSRTHVFESLRLLTLCPEAQAAIEAGTLKRSVALLVAQRPTHAMQLEYLKRVLTEGPGNTPLSYRSALDLARRNYMTDLAQAPFALEDATLCSTAGACSTCPKRTGASPELFEKTSSDVCTDTACFASKKDAHYEAMRAQAAERGQTIITGREARDLMSSEGAQPKGYLLLDKRAQGSESLRQVLGEDVPASKVVLIETPSGNFVEAIPVSAASTVMQERSKTTATKETASDTALTRESLQAQYQQRWRASAIKAIASGIRQAPTQHLQTLPPAVAEHIIVVMAERTSDDATLSAAMPSLPSKPSPKCIEIAAQDMALQPAPDVNLALMVLAMDHDADPRQGRPDDEAKLLEALAPIAGVSLEDIKHAVQAEMRTEAAQRGAPAAAATSQPRPSTGAQKPPKLTAADAQAAIAQAMATAGNPNQFAVGQQVLVRIDLKDSTGTLHQTNGALATIKRSVGDRAWLIDVQLDPDTAIDDLIADHTELEEL